MKKRILSIALLASVICSLSSCFVQGGRRGPHGHNRDRDHHYDNRYNRQW